jgi:hypothetical protein
MNIPAWEEACPALLHRKTLFLSSTAVCYRNITESVAWNKGNSVLLLTDMRSHKGLMRIISIVPLFPLIPTQIYVIA